MNHLVENKMLHEQYKLMDAVGYYEKLHAVHMEKDGSALDWRYNSLVG